MKKAFKHVIKSLGPLSILAIGATLALLLIVFKQSAPKAPAIERVWPIEHQVVQLGSYQPELILYGRIESRQVASLKSAVTAYVADTPVLEGQSVKKGQLLVQLDPIDAQQLLAQAEAEVARIENELNVQKNRNIIDSSTIELEGELLKLLERSVEREQELTKRNLAARSTLEVAELASVRQEIQNKERVLALQNHEAIVKQLEANLASAVARKNLAALNVERTAIKAPFDGIIKQRMISQGDRVEPNTPLIEIYATSELELRAQASTSRLKELSQAMDQGKVISAQLDGYEAIKVQLDRLAGEIEAQEAGIDVIFAIHESNPVLKLGQALKVTVYLPEQTELLMLPRTALYESPEGAYLYQVIEENDQEVLQAIQAKVVGERFVDDRGFVLLQANIKPNTKVLTTRLPYARNGLKVTTRES